MANSKSTPGPWEVEIVESGKDEVYARIKGVAFTDGIKVGVYKKKLPEEAKANACLISAAPELLEACKEMIELLRLQEENGRPVMSEKARERAQQAIARAE